MEDFSHVFKQADQIVGAIYDHGRNHLARSLLDILSQFSREICHSLDSGFQRARQLLILLLALLPAGVVANLLGKFFDPLEFLGSGSPSLWLFVTLAMGSSSDAPSRARFSL